MDLNLSSNWWVSPFLMYEVKHGDIGSSCFCNSKNPCSFFLFYFWEVGVEIWQLWADNQNEHCPTYSLWPYQSMCLWELNEGNICIYWNVIVIILETDSTFCVVWRRCDKQQRSHDQDFQTETFLSSFSRQHRGILNWSYAAPAVPLA